jgi:hypothetical protein
MYCSGLALLFPVKEEHVAEQLGELGIVIDALEIVRIAVMSGLFCIGADRMDELVGQPRGDVRTARLEPCANLCE